MTTLHITRIVEFSDTDMAGIVHFSNFFRFMEAAEHAYLRACGFSVVTTYQGEKITFPRVNASCDYRKPARFQDNLDIEVQLEKIGRSSLAWRFLFRLRGEEIATGRITSVLCRQKEDHSLEAITIPPEIRERLQHPSESSVGQVVRDS
jgi:YbgC/YbaW family acyl-CoA thioester hydrolase